MKRTDTLNFYMVASLLLLMLFSSQSHVKGCANLAVTTYNDQTCTKGFDPKKKEEKEAGEKV